MEEATSQVGVVTELVYDIEIERGGTREGEPLTTLWILNKNPRSYHVMIELERSSVEELIALLQESISE